MRRTWNEARQSLDHFFFTRETPFCLAIARIVLPFVLMAMSLKRWFHTRELYSADGATAQLGLGYGFTQFLPEFSGEIAVFLYTLMLLALVCVSIGWQTRLCLLVSCVLYTYFSMLDAISTMTKYTVISTHLLLLLGVSNCGAIWSVDAWLAQRKSTRVNPMPPAFDAWPRRLIQLMIGFVYFGAAVTKMNTPAFLSGDQLQLWMLTHINFRHPVGEWLSMYPVLIKCMAYITIVWEMTFIFLVWKTMFRPWVIGIGVLFHFGTTVLLGLFVFPLTCFTAYLAFVDEEDMMHARRWWRKQVSELTWLARCQNAVVEGIRRLGEPERWRQPAAVAFPSVMLLGSLGGVGLEYWLDPFGQRRPEGLHELRTLDPDFAARMLAPSEPLRDKDKFFAIDTGTLLVGDLLADRRKVFRQGDTMIAQCHLVPPHEDMWINLQMLDSGNRPVFHTGQIGLREAFRVNFVHKIEPAMEPGDYTLVFSTGGREVLRKNISVIARNASVSAH